MVLIQLTFSFEVVPGCRRCYGEQQKRWHQLKQEWGQCNIVFSSLLFIQIFETFHYATEKLS